jgi:hypothetical protein
MHPFSVIGAQKIERLLVSEPPDTQDSCTNAPTLSRAEN